MANFRQWFGGAQGQSQGSGQGTPDHDMCGGPRMGGGLPPPQDFAQSLHYMFNMMAQSSAATNNAIGSLAHTLQYNAANGAGGSNNNALGYRGFKA